MNTQLPLLPAAQPRKRQLRETAAWRVTASAGAPSLVDLLAVLIGGPLAQDTAERLAGRYTHAADLDAASFDELSIIKGLGLASATRLKAALALGKRLLEPAEERPTIRSPSDAANLVRPLVLGKDQEYLFVLLLDARNRVIGPPREILHGSVNSMLIRVGELFKLAVRVNAAAIVVAHNHPSGDPSPSPEDVATTRSIVEAGKLLDIDVLDHLVLGAAGRFVSLKERGLGFS